jgi:zinc-ribbon domain
MAKFCGKCGSPLNDTAIFCGSCGAKIPAAAPAQPAYTAPPAPTPDPASWAPVPASYSPPASTPDPAGFAPVSTTYPPPPAYAPAPTAYTPANFPAPGAKKSNTLLKVVIAVVVLICVGSALALAGLYYAAQKVTQKAHAVAAQALGGSSSSTPGGLGGLLGGSTSSVDAGGFKGDPCRFLSKAEVSQAVGITVIRTEAKDDGCSYIAKGDPADVTSKHMASMLGSMGADAQTQKTIQKMAGGLFAQQEATDKDLSAEAATGEIPVLVVGFTSGNAAMEMKMNRGAFEHIKGGAPFGAGHGSAAQTATGDLTGIGDEAYVAGGSMLMVRKGNTVARFMYISCPCNTDNIKPLAQKLASQL